MELRSAEGKAGGRAKAHRADRGGFLFTHRGFSGPAVLDLSHHSVVALNRGAAPPALLANWSGESREAWDARLTDAAAGRQLVTTRLSAALPARLADALCAEAGVPPETRVCELRREHRQRLLELLTAYRLPVDGHQGYKKAEVTGGGVALEEVSPRTLESRRAPGVFICGGARAATYARGRNTARERIARRRPQSCSTCLAG